MCGGAVMGALLDTNQAAEKLLGEATRKNVEIVRRMIADKEITARRIGRKLFVLRTEIERLGGSDAV